MLVECWTSVAHGRPAFNQHWIDFLCLLGNTTSYITIIPSQIFVSCCFLFIMFMLFLNPATNFVFLLLIRHLLHVLV